MNDYSKNGKFNPFLFTGAFEADFKQPAATPTFDFISQPPAGLDPSLNPALEMLKTGALRDWVKVN